MRKGGKIPFQNLLKNLTLHCLKAQGMLCRGLTCSLCFLTGFPLNRIFFSPFLISGHCGIFNRLHHFGVRFSWGRELRCIIMCCGKWRWCEGWGRRLLNHRNMFPIQKKMTVCRMFDFLPLCAHGDCSFLKWRSHWYSLELAWFHFCFRNLLLLQRCSQVCSLFSVCMS